MFKDLVLKNRSYRRFDENYEISETTLLELVDLARQTPSGANLQPLKYYLSADKETNNKIFSTLKWAGYLKDWNGPIEGERPTGYIVVLLDLRIKESIRFDVGIAAQTILLGATELGLGGCMFGAVERDELKKVLDLPFDFEIPLVIALGKPVEHVVMEDIPADGSIKYYRDEDGTHHVPKRRLEDIVIR